MKKSPEHVRRVKQLVNKLKKDGGKASLEVVDDSTRALLLGILSNYASEQRAAAAMRKVLEAVVDMNELRVTPVADLVTVMGADFPRGRQAAGEITAVLNSVFNNLHHLDVSFLKPQSKKAVNTFLSGLDGLTPHAAAFFRSRYLNHSEIPLDESMFIHLQRAKCLPDGTNVEDAQRFISDILSEREAANFYAMFKKFATAHAPRKTARRPEPVQPAAEKASPVAPVDADPDIEDVAEKHAGPARPRSSRPAKTGAAGKPAARKKPSREAKPRGKTSK